MLSTRTPRLYWLAPRPATPPVPGWIRHAEWWFVPAPGFKPRATWVRLEEPLGLSPTGRMWTADFCVRFKPRCVYACDQVPVAVGPAEYQRLLRVLPEARTWRWRQVRYPARIYVRGTVHLAAGTSVTLTGWFRAVRLPLSAPRVLPAARPA